MEIIKTESDVKKLGIRDIRRAMLEFDPASEEAKTDIRFLVRYYYAIQEDRKRTGSQLREAYKRKERNDLLMYLHQQNSEIESSIKRALETYTEGHPICQWLKNIYGIGPIISAGIVSHIDITRAPTSGHIESFAGYNPNMIWEEGKKRPYNAFLKVIFFHAGTCFARLHKRDDCVYGKWFLVKLQEYRQRNDAGEYAEEAKRGLRKYGKETVAYKTCLTGKLPAAQIVARARRWTIKLFISHLHEYWYTHHYKEAPAKPYAISILGHAHHIRFGEYPKNYKDLAPPIEDVNGNQDYFDFN